MQLSHTRCGVSTLRSCELRVSGDNPFVGVKGLFRKGNSVYTVKQVAIMTGLPATTLRAWERRYGVVHPHRTESHYRMFSEAEVARLRAMVQLIEAGATARKAAEIVLNDVDELGLGEEQAHEPAPAVLPPAMLAEAAANFDTARLGSVLERALPSEGFEQAHDEWLLPATAQLDDWRAAGRLTQAQATCADRAIERRVGTLLDAEPLAVPPGEPADATRPVVLVGQAQAPTRQALGLSLTLALRRRGVDARYLGAAIPVDDWTAAVRQLQPRGLVIGAMTRAGARDVHSVMDQLRELRPATMVWAAGPGFPASTPRRLPPTLADSVRPVLTLLRGATGERRGRARLPETATAS